MGMVIEAPIPRHITGIYVFAVMNLLAMLCLSSVSADIIVKDTMSNETAAKYTDMQAKFGPDFPEGGLEGRLVYAQPNPQACGELKGPPSIESKYPWILLVARGGNCQFVDKVLNAQLQNYSAVIVHNYEHKDVLVPMGGGSNSSKVTIPSTFVGWTNGMELRHLYDYTHQEYLVKIFEDEEADYSRYLWPFLLVLAICILMVMIFLLIKFLRDHASRRFCRLSNKHLKKIPVRKFKKGDYYDTCAICLEEYEEGEKIRVLPCEHVYHRRCIDPWLTKNKKTCPMCKRRVIPKRSADSESESDVEEGEAFPEGSETTPLLLGGRPGLARGQQSHGSMSGTTATPSVHEHGPADLNSEQGAVGGVGVSERTYHHPVLQVHTVSHRGNIQTGDNRQDVRAERKRRRQNRERREVGNSHGDDDSVGTPVFSETRGHREKRKKRKERKRRTENRSANQVIDQTGREENSIETAPEVNADDDDVNRNYAESHHVVMPAASSSRRRELNEVV